MARVCSGNGNVTHENRSHYRRLSRHRLRSGAAIGQQDFHVFITGRKPAAGEKAVKTIGERATFVPLDVTDEQSIRGAVSNVGAPAEHGDRAP